ncbi:MAG: response regulator [Acidimicrobiales bacterium]
MSGVESGVETSVETKTRVVFVDDHRAFAEALGLAVSLESDLCCVGEAATCAEGARLIATEQPDVAVIDYRLPDGDGIDLLRSTRLISPRTEVVMVTGHADLEVMARAARAGAGAFLSKESTVREVLTAIRGLRASAAQTGDAPGEHPLAVGAPVGNAALQASVEQFLLQSAPADGPAVPHLTRRELDVLLLLAEGVDLGAASRRLGLSVHTGRGYVKSILRKLDAHSQLEAVAVARRLGLLERQR